MKKQLLLLSILSLCSVRQVSAWPNVWANTDMKRFPKAAGDARIIPFIFTNATTHTMAVHPYNNQTKGKVIGVTPPGSLSVQINVPEGVTTVAVYQKLANGQYKKVKEHNLKGTGLVDRDGSRFGTHTTALVPNALLAFHPSKNVGKKTIGADTNAIKVVEMEWFPNSGNDAAYFKRLIDQAMPKAKRIKKAKS